MSGVNDLVTWLRQQLDIDAQDIAPVAGWTSGPDRLTTMQGTTVLMPARRTLAEVDAKRRIVEEADGYSPELEHGDNGEWAFNAVLRLLALPYADRPGYRQEWKP
jgi:hypothetical protein